MTDLDWSVLRLPTWTPLHVAVGKGATRMVRGLFRIGGAGSGIYALTREIDDRDRDVKPQLGAVMWALDDEVATALYERAPLPGDVASRVRPPELPVEALVGIPLLFGPALQHTAGRAQLSVRHRFADGAFAHSNLSYDGVELHYARANPEPEDLAVGATLNLRH